MAAPNVPGNARVLYASGQDIEIGWNWTPLIPLQPEDLYVVWNTVNDPNDVSATQVPAGVGQGNVANAEITIPSQVTVYIWGRTIANAITTTSAVPLVYQSDNTGRPGTPYLVGSVDDRITVNFQSAVPPGSTSYEIIYSTQNDPNLAPPAATNTVFSAEAPDIWGSGPWAVPQNVDVYIWSSATTDGIRRLSDPPMIYNSGAGRVPPSGPTTTPALLLASNSQLAVYFTAFGVTGTPPFNAVCGASTSPAGPFTIPTNVQGTFPNYNATTIPELDFNTTYFFQTILSNGAEPSRTSAVSPGFSTLNLKRVGIPVSTLVYATQVTMRFNLPVAYFNSNNTTAELRWGSETVLPPALLPNSISATYLGLIQGDPVWEASLFGMTPNKTYNFQGYYVPIGPEFASGMAAVLTDEGNSFDLGYMPPRSWAAPNPTYSQGISLPWRQT
jgi:hypothetical protein